MEIIKDLGIVTIVGGLVAFIIRSFIGKYFDQKAKNFELELRNKSDLYKSELEMQAQKYKSDLDIHLTKASRFHEKRLETISDLYKMIVDVRINLSNLTSTFVMSTGNEEKDLELKEQRKIDAGKSYDNFRDYYDKKRIFIPKETCELIDKLKSESFSVLSDYHYRERFKDVIELSNRILKEINEKTDKVIPSILAELESDFRKTVDVENEK